MQPAIFKKEPTAFEVQEGKTYAWCTCGYSALNPICDGAHKQFATTTNDVVTMPFKSLKFTAEKNETVWLCNCKQTKTPPFCDGSHNSL
jgi:CDGSH iron-sulfur domain-containing protein 3